MKASKRISPASSAPASRPPVVFALLPDEVLKNYQQTRPIPRERLPALFDGVITGQATTRLLDVGCGIGRLAIPVAVAFPSLSVIGIDVSPDAVRLARRQRAREGIPARRLQFRPAELLQFAAFPTREPERFTHVLCHWCFHCIRPWRSAVLACALCCDLSSRPKLVWLEEESDLYLALDALGSKLRSEQAQQDAADKWKAFWETYHGLRAPLEPHGRSDHRTGTALRCTSEVKEFLELLGWQVHESQHAEQWSQAWRYGDLLDKCLAPRAFTNLQRLERTQHDRALLTFRRELGRGAMPRRDDQVTLQYSAKVVTASPGAPVESLEEAKLCIQKAYTDIAEEVLDLALLSKNNDEVLPVLRAALANFFALLFRPEAAPQWSAFWNHQSRTGSGGRPLWVWIRFLAASEGGFRSFLRDCLWAFSADPRVLKAVVPTYFRSRATLAHVAFSRTRNKSNPLLLRVDGGGDATQFAVQDSRDLVEIVIPKAFVSGRTSGHRYCASVDIASFNAGVWQRMSKTHLDGLFGPEPGDEQKRVRAGLATFARELDSALGVTTYERDVRGFVRVVQAATLFPGPAYYFFPVRDGSGDLVSSVSLGLPQRLSDRQMTVLRDCIHDLLRVPSLILSPRVLGRR